MGEEGGDETVEEDVGQVEGERVRPSQAPVQSEGETGEGPVGLVGPGVSERDPPVVSGHQGGEGGDPADDGVLQDAGSVREDLLAS